MQDLFLNPVAESAVTVPGLHPYSFCCNSPVFLAHGREAWTSDGCGQHHPLLFSRLSLTSYLHFGRSKTGEHCNGCSVHGLGWGHHRLATPLPCLGSIQHLLKLMEEATLMQDVFSLTLVACHGPCPSPWSFSKPPPAWLTHGRNQWGSHVACSSTGWAAGSGKLYLMLRVIRTPAYDKRVSIKMEQGFVCVCVLHLQRVPTYPACRIYLLPRPDHPLAVIKLCSKDLWGKWLCKLFLSHSFPTCRSWQAPTWEKRWKSLALSMSVLQYLFAGIDCSISCCNSQIKYE